MGEWISVEDKLPEDCEPVLIRSGGYYPLVIIGTYYEGRFVQDTSVSEAYGGDPLGDLYSFDVEFWMSLPGFIKS